MAVMNSDLLDDLHPKINYYSHLTTETIKR